VGDGEKRDRSFADLVKGVHPLRDRSGDRVAPPPAPRDAHREKATEPDRKTDAFVQPEPGEPALGHAPGLDRRQWRRLRSGDWRPERRIDLHGLDRARARAAVRAGIEAALAESERCLLVIHGRGRGSEDGPVLREALPGWLAEPPLRAHVLAFAPAVSRDGGAGASYVLLRKSAA
jgi:DNA-nicking Smr family endonuclease